MSFGTVIPETAATFSEAVVTAVQAYDQADLPSAVMVQEITQTCLEFADKFEAEEQSLRQLLAQGVDARKFVLRYETILELLEKTVSSQARLLAETDRLGQVSPLFGGFLAAFERFGTAVRKVRDLTKLVLSNVKTPWPPVDLQKLREAQAAFARGEMKPFRRQSAKGEN